MSERVRGIGHIEIHVEYNLRSILGEGWVGTAKPGFYIPRPIGIVGPFPTLDEATAWDAAHPYTTQEEWRHDAWMDDNDYPRKAVTPEEWEAGEQ